MVNERLAVTVCFLSLTGALAAGCAAAETPEQAAKRFTRAFLSYAPATVIEISQASPGYAGPYVPLSAIRTNINPDAKEQLGLLIDPAANTVAAGMLFPIQQSGPPITIDTLPAFAEGFLAEQLSKFFQARVRIRWPAIPVRPTGVIPLSAEISSGYGNFRLPLAVGVDARHLIIGDTWPLDRDPRAVRREILAKTEVHWDVGHENAPVKVVEFSDFECPACKRGWAKVKPILEEAGDRVRHGLVAFPLVAAHPWAFRAAVAGQCVSLLWPADLVLLKEEFYRLQDTLTVETVDPAVFGFLAQHSLDEAKFRSCYLKDPSIDAVLRQLEVGYRLGVTGTPTYFVNGEPLPWTEPDWFTKRLRAIIAAGNPEGAAEIVASPPTPTPVPPTPRATVPTSAAPSPAPKR